MDQGQLSKDGSPAKIEKDSSVFSPDGKYFMYIV